MKYFMLAFDILKIALTMVVVISFYNIPTKFIFVILAGISRKAVHINLPGFTVTLTIKVPLRVYALAVIVTGITFGLITLIGLEKIGLSLNSAYIFSIFYITGTVFEMLMVVLFESKRFKSPGGPYIVAIETILVLAGFTSAIGTILINKL